MTLKEKFQIFDKNNPTKICKVAGYDFAYRYYQNPDTSKNVTLVLLAGGSGLGDGFFYLYDYFVNDYNILSFNYPLDFKDNNTLADAIAFLINKLKLTNVYLMGQSYGGFLAQIIAAHHSDVIKGLILSGTAGLGKGLNEKDREDYKKRFDIKKTKRNIRIDKILPMPLLVFMFKKMAKKVIKDPKMAEDFKDIVDICKSSMSGKYFAHMDYLLGDLRNYVESFVTSDFKNFDNETLLIFSKEDTIFSETQKQNLISLMTNPLVIEDLKGGHLALMQSTKEYAKIVNDFISKRNESYQ